MLHFSVLGLSLWKKGHSGKSDTESGSYDLECSMGGAIAVRVAAKRALPTLAGLVVVDVVEVRCIYSREMSSLQLTICSE